jgi:hypothetical protein
MSMYVMKRDGKRESVHFDKITSRISKLCNGLDTKVCEKTIKETEKRHSNILLKAHFSPVLSRLLFFAARRPRNRLAKGHPGRLPRRHHLAAR